MIRALLLTLALASPFFALAAAKKTECQNHLQSLAPPEDFVLMSFYADAHEDYLVGRAEALKTNLELLANVERVLSEAGLLDQVRLVSFDRMPTDQNLVDAFAKGISRTVIDEFFPAWYEGPYEFGWRSLADERYLKFRTYAGNDIKWFEISVSKDYLDEIIDLLESEIPDVTFLDRGRKFAGPPVTF